MQRFKQFIYLSALCFMVLYVTASVAQNKSAIRDNYPDGKFPPGIQLFTAGDSCNGTGVEQHDGPVHGNGYTAFTDSVRMVIKFHPVSYPWTYTNVCMAFTRTSTGPTSHLYDIVVYDTLGAGGTPGALLQVYPGNTISGIGIYPAYSWNSQTVSIPVSASLGAVYIGYRYANSAGAAFYCTVDEQASTPLWPGYYATNTTFPAVWQTIQSVAGFTAYKCMAIRTQGSAPVAPPLCEQFTSTTYPPTGWTLNYTGTLYWSRAAVNVLCQGSATGSSEFDFYDASSGTTQDLITLNVLPAVAGDSLYFWDAYASFTTEDDQLTVFASTNGGTTYNSGRLFHGGVSGELVTAPPQTAVFVPSCTQWHKLVVGIPVGTNKIKFTTLSAFGNNLYIDSVCIRSGITGISHNQSGVPTVYSLSQNYPNPFNPTTNIKFGLPKSGLVKMVIYDVLGRVVETPVNEFKTAGNYEINFDASNMASGVYFYRIEANDFTQTKKMLLIK